MNGDQVKLCEHGLLSLPNRLAPVMEHHILCLHSRNTEAPEKEERRKGAAGCVI
jgi:hypothetical protein